MASRSYKRASNGKFSGSGGAPAETIKQNRAKHSATKKQLKNKLSGNALGGKSKSTRAQVQSKVKGTKTVTAAARKAAQRTRKRFG